MTLRRALLLAALFVAALAVAAPARAQGRPEAVARDALQQAQADYATGAYDKAITRLTRAMRACTRCAAPTRALILRDLGAIEFKSGDEDGGYAHFVESLALDPKADVSQRYATSEVRSAFAAAKDEAALTKAGQPSGDFVHTPPTEQVVRTPIPLYFETDTQLSKVHVRFEGTASKDWGRVELSRVGNGWGGQIPCDDVAYGVMRYYVVGLDASGIPAATGGDARHPYFVRIRNAIEGTAPSLPGRPPPQECTGETKAPAEAPAAEKPADTAPNEEVPEKKSERPPPKGGFARLWIGVAGVVDLSSLPADNDVCRVDATGAGASAAGYVCTTPNGAVFPPNRAANDAIPSGRAGAVGGGFAAGDVRVLLAVDYAASANLLLGARVGYVTNGYISGAQQLQKGFTLPLHAEARVTYLFGDAPLGRVGFAPLVLAGVGAAEWDVSNTVQVSQTGIAGQQPMTAWKASGPLFVTAGGGARYSFSPWIAFTSALRASAAFGSGVLFSVSPELALQYGF